MKTKLRSLKISADDLLEILKRAAARGEISCTELSPALKIYRHGEHRHYCIHGEPHTGVIDVAVEVEDEIEADQIGNGDYLPVIRVEMAG